MNKPVAFVLILCCLSLIVCLAYFHGKDMPGRALPPSSPGSSTTPTVDGEIVAVEASPDFSRVLLLAANQRGDRVFATLYAPIEKRLIGHLALPYSHPLIAWSPDSAQVAVFQAASRDVFLLNRAGKGKHFTLQTPVLNLIWEGATHRKLLYYGDQAGRIVYELDSSSGRSQAALTGYTLAGLSIVQGRPCIGYLHGMTLRQWDDIAVMDLQSRKTKLEIPFYAPEDKTCDDYLLDVSPDGRYFYLYQGASGGSRTLIAAAEDAAVVMKKIRYAIDISSGVRGASPTGIRWSPYTGEDNGHFAEVGNGTSFVNLISGLRLE